MNLAFRGVALSDARADVLVPEAAANIEDGHDAIVGSVECAVPLLAAREFVCHSKRCKKLAVATGA